MEWRMARGVWVSNTGLVWLQTQGKAYCPSACCDGYRCVSIAKKRVGVGVLVAEAFIGPRPTAHSLDHIDQDRGNNCVENLRWATSSEQNCNKTQCDLNIHRSNQILQYKKLNSAEWLTGNSMSGVARMLSCDQGAISKCIAGKLKQHHGYVFRRIDNVIEGEEWVTCKLSGMQISSMGRFKGKCTGAHSIARTPVPSKGMRYATVKYNDKTWTFHRLVCTAGPPESSEHATVDHINRNTKDNRASNLRWATTKEQRANQDRKTIKKTSLRRPVQSKKCDGENWVRYNSMRDAALETGASTDGIAKCCRGHLQSSGGCVWEFV